MINEWSMAIIILYKPLEFRLFTGACCRLLLFKERLASEVLGGAIETFGKGGLSSGLGMLILIISALKTFDLNEGSGGT